ncbi:hypothetical protein POM88_024784 [Heracleum sosnowskyi]|uniref:Uncharacterized protein n=1 Tax=Heracleum sosnowskyi TaxID=360622 RepID=A0AAD8I5S7_9APIA|nr:hypothetical protein POM88_024784 [Heracleum sosnowskyi]
MVDLCKPYGKIEVYVDSSLTDETIEADRNDIAGGGDGGDDGDDGYNGDNGDDMAEDSGDSEGDPAYEYENDSDETEELDSGASDIDDARINAENAQNEGAENAEPNVEKTGQNEGESATNEGAENAPNEGQGAENAEPNVEKTGQNEGECPTNEGQTGEAGQMIGPKRNKLGIRRPKLIIRRPKTKGLVIKDSTVIPTQASQTISTVPTDEMGKCKGKETSSSETSHFMYQVLGSVGYDALYCQIYAHPWVWTQPPYNKGPFTSPTV